MQQIFAPWDAVAELPPAAIADLPLALLPRTRLFGLDLVCGERGSVARDLVAMARAGQCATVQFINAHCINVAHADLSYRAALAAADFLLPDGSGLAIAARLAGVALGDNLNGTDLFPEVCAAAAGPHNPKGRVPIYLLGGQPGIAAGTAREMRGRFPTLRIAGTRHGFWSAAQEDAIIAEINDSGAAILFVALGVPRQEKWIAANRHRLTARLVLGVGGLFDYYSGAIPRAPAWLQRAGLEWVWRWLQEPRRLFIRYMVGNPRFLANAATHAVHARQWAGRVSLALKRRFDRTVAGVALLVLGPLFAAIALAIKLEDRGPVFFRQTRIGEAGRPFAMWKFRSMVVDAEARLAAIRAQSERDDTCFKMRADPRVTRVGGWLRRLSLDELPQLINVVRGEMSIVGPRPALPREVIAYDAATRARLGGLPGLTCTWQVSGRADIPFVQQVALDIDYLRERSLWGDLKLILQTIPAVLSARGAY